MTTAFYAYIHCKPDFTPFYVGKGRLKRANSLKQRNPYYMATVGKYGAENIIIGKFACSTEENALALEIGIIKCLKKAGIKLTNFTNGGEGASGCIPTAETRAKMSAAKMGKTHSEETRAKMSEVGKKRTFSAETRAKMSAAGMGKTRFLGKTHSEETRAKMSAAQMGNTNFLGKTHSKEAKAKMSVTCQGEKNSMYGKTHSAESKAKMSEAGKKRTHSEETRAKMSASHKLRRINGST